MSDLRNAAPRRPGNPTSAMERRVSDLRNAGPERPKNWLARIYETAMTDLPLPFVLQQDGQRNWRDVAEGVSGFYERGGLAGVLGGKPWWHKPEDFGGEEGRARLGGFYEPGATLPGSDPPQSPLLPRMDDDDMMTALDWWNPGGAVAGMSRAVAKRIRGGGGGRGVADAPPATPENYLSTIQPGFSLPKADLPGIAIRESGVVSPAPRKVGEAGKWFDDDFMRRHGRQYDYSDPADVNRAMTNVGREIEYQIGQEVSGIGWYDDGIKETWRISGRAIPALAKGGRHTTPYGEELTTKPLRQWQSLIAAVTSPQTFADENWGQALSIFEGWQNAGTLPLRKESGKKWGVNSKHMALDFLNFNEREVGVRNTLKWLLDLHPISALREMRARSGVWSPQGGNYGVKGKADDIVPGVYILGEKVGPFMRNLNGIPDETVDLWGVRQWNRNMGRATSPNLPKGKTIKDQPSDLERRVIKDGYSRVADNLGLTSRDAQAVGWYYEQQLFNAMGVRSAVPTTTAEGATKWGQRGWGWQ